MTPLRTAAACSLLYLVSACSAGDGAAGQWNGTREPLPGGGELVRNPAEPVWSEDESWMVEETGRIGAIDGPEEYVFGQLIGIALGEDGTTIAFDGQAHELRTFDADGTIRQRFGRRGAGPGEFQHVTGIALAPDGSVWVVDPANSRYTIVAEDGSHRVLPRDAGPYRAPWLGGFTTDGDLVDSVVSPAATTYSDALVRIAPDGSVTDTVPLPTIDVTVPRLGRIEFPLPYAPRPVRALDPSGHVWSASTGEYRFVRTSLAGDTTLIVTGVVAPRPLSRAEQDSVARYVRTLNAEIGLSVPDDALPVTAPPLRWLTVDDRGHLWAGLHDADTKSASVHDREGRMLGTVALPFRVGALPPVIRGDRMLAVSEDESGAPVLIQATIRRR